MWAVSRRKIFSNLSYREAFGISCGNQWFPWGEMMDSARNNKIRLNHFDKKQLEVDLLLDIDKKELRICVVGKKGKDKEAVISNVEYPDKQNKGFVPHINFGGSGQLQSVKVRIVKLPVDLYGEPHDDIFVT